MCGHHQNAHFLSINTWLKIILGKTNITCQQKLCDSVTKYLAHLGSKFRSGSKYWGSLFTWDQTFVRDIELLRLLSCVTQQRHWVFGDLVTWLSYIKTSWCCPYPGPIFCLLLGVSSDYAQPITGQVTEVTCPVIGRAQPELTLSKRQKTGPGIAGPLWCESTGGRWIPFPKY